MSDKCHLQCGACCIVLSISSPVPGMPSGKPAGVQCIHLDAYKRCAIYNHPDRPVVCRIFKVDSEVCGQSPAEAFEKLATLEGINLTRIQSVKD